MIELTRNFPTVELIERIANALNIKVYELFKENDALSIELEQLRKEIAGDFEKLINEFIEKTKQCNK
jgi:transcriptional regulator with XRE-family HTH domain